MTEQQKDDLIKEMKEVLVIAQTEIITLAPRLSGSYRTNLMSAYNLIEGVLTKAPK